jgi:Ca-activated chloride channel family protein
MRRLSSLALLLCGLAAAQSKQPAPDSESPTFSTDTNWVILPVSVSDKGGKLVTNLQQNSFKVFENGIEQPIKLFRHEDVPISLGIIIDNSGSMKEKRQKVEVASVDLVKASNPHDEVFIVNFNDEAYLDVPFTNDIKKMEEGVARIDSRGGTAMRDAIRGAIDYLKEKAKNHKKVLLVVTDGNDNASNIGLERLVDGARQSEVLIYAIGLLDEEEHREAKAAKRALNALTQESGGLSFYPKGVAEVDAIALQVAHEIRNQYTIAYSPLNLAKDGTFRQIKVVVTGPSHAQVRTRSGYYANPDAPAKTASKN